MRARYNIYMKNKNGFTLAELLIVVAIIGVLVAISIPVFTSQLEKAKQATDLANMRSAKAAALAEWMTDGMPDGYSRKYDAGRGTMTDSTPGGYGKSSKPANTFSTENVSGTPNDNGTAAYLTVNIDSDGAVSFIWGASSYGAKWSSLGGTTINTSSGGNWYGIDINSKNNKKAAYDAIRATSNEKRREADIDALNSIADFFNKTDTETLKQMLGDQYTKATRGNGLLFAYQVDGGDSYSVQLNPDGATTSTEYLTALGYSANVFSNGSHGLGEKKDEYNYFGWNNEHNYVDTYLFTSDEVIENRGQNHQVKFAITDSGTKIWITGTDIETFVEK